MLKLGGASFALQANRDESHGGVATEWAPSGSLSREARATKANLRLIRACDWPLRVARAAKTGFSCGWWYHLMRVLHELLVAACSFPCYHGWMALD